MLETNLLILLCPILVLAGALCVSRQARKTLLTTVRKPRPKPPVAMPSVGETAETIRRFRHAAARYLAAAHRTHS